MSCYSSALKNLRPSSKTPACASSGSGSLTGRDSHIPDAAERIHRAREKFEQLTESITVHEALVEAQRSQLDLLNQPVDYDDEMPDAAVGEIKTEVITDEMLAEEEEAVRQLEKKKEELELKLKSIDRQMSTVYRNV